MKNFRTYNLALDFFKDCQSLKLNPVFKDQFERASLSIVLNLAEGSAKPTTKDRRKFYFIAMGSLREVQAILQIKSATQLSLKSDQLAGCLYRLLQNPGGSP